MPYETRVAQTAQERSSARPGATLALAALPPPSLRRMIRLGPTFEAYLAQQFGNLTVEDAVTLGFEFHTFQTYEVNLNRSEAERSVASLTTDVRRCVRKAARDSVTLEEAYHPDFMDDYYAQL